MRLILSPAKKMREDETLSPWTTPCYLADARHILDALHGLTSEERKKLWACNETIAAENEERLRAMELSTRLTPAILSYDGIQYQYMAPSALDSAALEWVQEHLRILSGFYGVLRPMDGVVPYRLEMQAKARFDGTKNLYEYWGKRLYEAVLPEDKTILNLASAEYSKAIEKYMKPEDRLITCVFYEAEKGKYIQKGVYAKMARGEMTRYLAEIRAKAPEEAQSFARLDYVFHPELSNEKEYVFLREMKTAKPMPVFDF